MSSSLDNFSKHDYLCPGVNDEGACTCQIELSKAEARAIVNELGRTFIDRDNPLCNQVLTKLSKFVDDK
jgi:hypothetical protein